MGPTIYRRDSAMPYQQWNAFPEHAIVQVWNAYGETDVGPANSFWWGYETECGEVGGGVITKARRLDRERL